MSPANGDPVVGTSVADVAGFVAFAAAVVESTDWARATPATDSNSRATTLAARAREFMLGKLRERRKIRWPGSVGAAH